MSAEWLKTQPSNRNYLTPTGFKLNLELFDGVDFFCQSINLPDITMPYTSVPTRFRDFPIVPGGGLEFGDLRIKFIVDEDLHNYISVHNWIKTNAGANQMTVGDPQYSSGQLFIMTSNYNTNIIIDFERMFPIGITELSFDTTATDVEYFTADVTFKFVDYTFRNKNFETL
jgi:hypothetical protein